MLNHVSVQMCFLRFGFAAVVAASLVGCSEEIVKAVIPAEGTLTIDGVGAANVMVRFVPDGNEIDGNLSSSAVTDEQGHFRLVATDGRDGAMPGSGHVLLVDLNEERPAQGEEATTLPRFPSGLGVLTPQSMIAEIVANQPLTIQVPVQNVAEQQPVD